MLKILKAILYICTLFLLCIDIYCIYKLFINFSFEGIIVTFISILGTITAYASIVVNKKEQC